MISVTTSFSEEEQPKSNNAVNGIQSFTILSRIQRLPFRPSHQFLQQC